MDYNKIIIILAVVFVVLLVAFFAVFNSSIVKEDCIINITSDATLHDGDYFSIKLSDVKANPIANQTVNVTIIDANGIENHQMITTDAQGNGMLQLNGLEPGEYTFNVTFAGNGNYKASAFSAKITIAALQTTSSSVSQSSQPSDWYDSDGAHHFYENGKEYVGSREGQHMDIETRNYVREHGMT